MLPENSSQFWLPPRAMRSRIRKKYACVMVSPLHLFSHYLIRIVLNSIVSISNVVIIYLY